MYAYTPPVQAPPDWRKGGGNPYHSPKTGQFTTGPGDGQKKSLSWDELRQFLEDEFHPIQMEAKKEKHPRSGFEVEVGIERRVFHPDVGQEGPAEFTVWDHGQLGPKRPLFPIQRPNEPIPHVYRGMSLAEWDQAQERGYIKSDGRGTIASWEGTNAAADPRSAVSYLPIDGTGVVVKIRVDARRKWFTYSADSYVRSREQVPLSEVEHVSPEITKERRGGVYIAARSLCQQVLPDWRKGGGNPYHSPKTGEFTTGPGGAAGYVPGKWHSATDEERLKAVADMWEPVVRDVNWFKSPRPSKRKIREIAEERARSALEYRDEKILVNGPHWIIAESKAGASDAEMRRVAKAVDGLQTRNPIPKGGSVNLVIADSWRMSAYGETETYSGRIRLSSFTLTEGPAPKGSTQWMPTAQRVPNAEYTLAHEWGHAVSKSWDDDRKLGTLWNGNDPNMSDYGRTSPYEAQAEAFAEWYLTNGKTTNSTVLKYATTYGWK